MNKQKTHVKLIISAIIIVIFAMSVPKVLNAIAKKYMMTVLGQTRASLYGDVPKEKRLLVGFGKRIEHEICYGTKEGETSIQEYLDAGCNPDYCLNLIEGWQFNNPLMLFNTAAMYTTYDKDVLSYPDIKVFNQLISAGADINKYPYVWAAVFCHDNYGINKTKSEFQKGYITEEEMRDEISCDIADANRVLKLFLDAGADINRKGSYVPFEKGIREKITEEEIQKYFSSTEATTPLYEAIKKGMLWESQVDLLLEYGAILDESCLEAARLSGDEAMLQKITALIEK